MAVWAEGMQEAVRIHAGFAGDDARAAAYWAEGAPEVPAEELGYPGGAGQKQRARLYRGGGAGVLLYIHGGGWVGGSIDLNESACRRIAAESGWDVLSVSYRFAPEHPFPAALDDCRAALAWLRGATGLAPAKVALGGASAGGNLAMGLALDRLAAGEAGDLAALVLVYGVFGDDFETASYRSCDEFGLTRAEMIDFLDRYDAGAHRADPRLLPLKAPSLAGLPPCLLIAAELDVLADDSRLMAAALARDGVAAELHVEPGVSHGYINRARHVPATRASLGRAAAFLARIGGEA